MDRSELIWWLLKNQGIEKEVLQGHTTKELRELYNHYNEGGDWDV